MSCGISSRFQLLSPSERQVPHALLTRPPLSSASIGRILFPQILVRLACVKHAASVHPEPESNPPQKNFAESQHVTLKNKKIDDRLIRKGASHENLTVLQGLPATRERADDELAIIDYKEVVQIRS